MELSALPCFGFVLAQSIFTPAHILYVQEDVESVDNLSYLHCLKTFYLTCNKKCNTFDCINEKVLKL